MSEKTAKAIAENWVALSCECEKTPHIEPGGVSDIHAVIRETEILRKFGDFE